MEKMREAWTDERLDDLNAKVDRGFDRVETEIRSQRHEFRSGIASVREEMNARFDRVDAKFESTAADVNARFDKIDARFDSTATDVNARFDRTAADVNARFDKIDARFDALNRTLLGFAVAALIALVAGAVSPF